MARPAMTVQWRVLMNDFPRIRQALVNNADDLVTKAAMDIEAGAKARAPVDTGFLRGSIQATRLGDARWEVVVGADYGLYVEHGTVSTAARPYFGPAVEAVRPAFVAAMKRVLSGR